MHIFKVHFFAIRLILVNILSIVCCRQNKLKHVTMYCSPTSIMAIARKHFHAILNGFKSGCYDSQSLELFRRTLQDTVLANATVFR
jgi:hypothetical protein